MIITKLIIQISIQSGTATSFYGIAKVLNETTKNFTNRVKFEVVASKNFSLLHEVKILFTIYK